jgi:hypothetical protein
LPAAFFTTATSGAANAVLTAVDWLFPDTTVMLAAASSSVTVPFPWLSANVPYDRAERFTKNVSFASNSVSPATVTVIVLLVWPAAKESEPLAAV